MFCERWLFCCLDRLRPVAGLICPGEFCDVLFTALVLLRNSSPVPNFIQATTHPRLSLTFFLSHLTLLLPHIPRPSCVPLSLVRPHPAPIPSPPQLLHLSSSRRCRRWCLCCSASGPPSRTLGPPRRAPGERGTAAATAARPHAERRPTGTYCRQRRSPEEALSGGNRS